MNTAIPTVEESIERMKREVLDYVQSGMIPRHVTSFCDLHDHIDANTLGGFCEDAIFDAMWIAYGGLPDQSDEDGMPLGMLGHVNAAQDAIAHWIAHGGLHGEGPVYECVWGAGYHAGGDELRDLSFFCEDNGYDAANLARVSELAVGETADLTDLSGVHTVTRIR